MITQERKDELIKAGYVIEDMAKEWGPEWEGNYRFMNSNDEDEFGVPQYSIEEAWDDCSQYHLSLVGLRAIEYPPFDQVFEDGH